LGHVDVLVSDEDRHLPSPFTQSPTASLILEKEKQAKERAIPPGMSKLRKYRAKKHESANVKVYKSFRYLWLRKITGFP